MSCNHVSSHEVRVNGITVDQCDICGRVLWARKASGTPLFRRRNRSPPYSFPAWFGMALVVSHVVGLITLLLGLLFQTVRSVPWGVVLYLLAAAVCLAVISVRHALPGTRKVTQNT